MMTLAHAPDWALTDDVKDKPLTVSVALRIRPQAKRLCRRKGLHEEGNAD